MSARFRFAASCAASIASSLIVTVSVAAQPASGASSPSASAFSAVVAGSNHFCALDRTAAVYCWGDGAWGQLGNGSTKESPEAVRIASDERFMQVAAGSTFSCALSERGQIFCWGSDVGGVLGEATFSGTCSTRACAKTPVAVATGMKFESISAGFEHMCGISAGRAYCWGRGDAGQLGTAPTLVACEEVLCSRKPVLVSDSLRFSSVSVRGMHSCGIADARVFCWGENSVAQAGVKEAKSIFVPMQVTGTSTYRQVSAGGRYSCAVNMAGSIDCWGENDAGRLGAAEVSNTHSTVAAPAGERFVRVSVGGTHTCAVSDSGSAYCWGLALDGRLGGKAAGRCARFECSATPVRVQTSVKFVDVAAGGTSSCGNAAVGSIFCWGSVARSMVAVRSNRR